LFNSSLIFYEDHVSAIFTELSLIVTPDFLLTYSIAALIVSAVKPLSSLQTKFADESKPIV
jgi:hypothetical protein